MAGTTEPGIDAYPLRSFAASPAVLQILRRNPQFRRLWYSQVVSQGGDWLNRIAILSLIGALGSGEQAAGVGALFGAELAIRMLPAAVMGPTAGAFADRLPKRLVMITADLLRVGIVLAYLLVDEPDELGLLYTLLVVQMSLSMFFASARSAAVPQTVSREDLHSAYALSAVTWSAMLALGAAAGGVLVKWVGVRGVFLLDAATFLLSALILLSLRLPPVAAHPEPMRLRDLILFKDIRRAWHHARDKRLLPVLAAKTLWGGAGGFLVLLAVAGRERFAGSAAADADLAVGAAGFATGALYTARGLGTGLGPVLARRWFGSTELALRSQIFLGFLVGAAGYALFGLVEQSLAWAFFWVTLAHCGGSTIWVASTTWWQRKVDDAFRGRVFSLEFLGMTLAFTLGGQIAGWLYDLGIPLRNTVWVHCGLVVAGGSAWAILARRTA